jgi:hypothetical protein
MTKFRTSNYDAPAPIKKKPDEPPGTLPDHRIAVIDRQGRMRGNISRKATALTASRFLNGRGAALTTHNGQQVWKETK